MQINEEIQTLVLAKANLNKSQCSRSVWTICKNAQNGQKVGRLKLHHTIKNAQFVANLTSVSNKVVTTKSKTTKNQFRPK